MAPQLLAVAAPEVSLDKVLAQRAREMAEAAGEAIGDDPEALGKAARDNPKLRKLVGELYDFFEELEQIGCSYKDRSFSVGLVDFPAIIDGKKVELCWRNDEPEIAFYHGLEGYTGRKPIPKEYL